MQILNSGSAEKYAKNAFAALHVFFTIVNFEVSLGSNFLGAIVLRLFLIIVPSVKVSYEETSIPVISAVLLRDAFE